MVNQRLKAFSLVELVMAITLLGLILLAASSSDIGSRRFFSSSQRAAKVLDDANFIIEHMHKNIIQAKGNKTDKGYSVPDAHTLALRVKWSLLDGGSDSWVKYQLNPNQHILYFCTLDSSAASCDGTVAGAEILSKKVTSLKFDDSNTGSIDIDITLRYNPNGAVDVRYNPEVSLSTSAALLQHSFN